MSNYDNSNRGSIWKNDKKEKDTHPDFTGSLNVDGVEYWVSAWKRKPDQSERAPALSFSIKPKEEKPAQRQAQGAPARQPSANHPADFEDDIPFLFDESLFDDTMKMSSSISRSNRGRYSENLSGVQWFKTDC